MVNRACLWSRACHGLAGCAFKVIGMEVTPCHDLRRLRHIIGQHVGGFRPQNALRSGLHVRRVVGQINRHALERMAAPVDLRNHHRNLATAARISVRVSPRETTSTRRLMWPLLASWLTLRPAAKSRRRASASAVASGAGTVPLRHMPRTYALTDRPAAAARDLIASSSASSPDRGEGLLAPRSRRPVSRHFSPHQRALFCEGGCNGGKRSGPPCQDKRPWPRRFVYTNPHLATPQNSLYRKHV